VKFCHAYADTIHHATHDAVHTFMDDNRKEHSLIRLSYNPEFVWDYPLSVDLDTSANSAQDLFRWFGRRQTLIFLCQPVTRVHDPVRDIPVIGEQQQTFRVPIQPANREQPWF